MKSKLKAVAPKAAKPSKPKILIYGKPGVGKTWTSLDFPSCYFIDTEGGADLGHYMDKLEKSGGVYYGIDQGSLDFINVIDQVKALATEKHQYKTLVIDSITKIFLNEIAAEAQRLADAGAVNEYGRDRKPAVNYVKTLMSWLQRLDMTVILISHEKSAWGMVKGQRQEIGTTFDCYDKLEYELHLALNIIRQGKEHIAVVTKSRLSGFSNGKTFPWSYSEFANKFGKDVIEAEAAPIVLPTQEQLLEIDGIIKTFNVSKALIDAWFTKANCTNFAEMDADKLQAVINSYKSKIIKE